MTVVNILSEIHFAVSVAEQSSPEVRRSPECVSARCESSSCPDDSCSHCEYDKNDIQLEYFISPKQESNTLKHKQLSFSVLLTSFYKRFVGVFFLNLVLLS